jgi:hypothetical protein
MSKKIKLEIIGAPIFLFKFQFFEETDLSKFGFFVITMTIPVWILKHI